MIGALFRTMGPFAPPPPPGAQPPPLWGSEAHLRELFGDRVEFTTLERDVLEVTAFERAARLRRALQGRYGPTIAARANAERQRARGRVRRRARRVLRRVEPRHRERARFEMEYLLRRPGAGARRPCRQALGGGSGLAPRADAELAEHRRDVVVDGLGEITSSRAISALVAPARSAPSTSVSRGVSPPGPTREAARGPRGIRLTPAARSRRRRWAAERSAPSSS